jgi:hypothetical protein
VEDLGIAGLVRTALYLDTVCGLEILSIGRAALERSECSMEVVGTHLLMRLELRGSWVWLSACGLDEAGGPEPICNFGDGPKGWSNIRGFLATLERSGIKSLHPRPIRIGAGGTPDSYTIDY